MGPVGEEKVPEMEDLRQRRCTGTESQDGWECIEFGLHSLGEEIRRQLGFHDLQASVDQKETAMDAVHGAADVTGTFARDERVEEGEGLDFAAGGVKEGRAQHIHALHVDRRVAGDVAASAAGRGMGRVAVFFRDARGCVDQKLHLASSRRRSGFVSMPVFDVM